MWRLCVGVERLKWCCCPSKFCCELFWYGNNIWTHNNDVDGPSCSTPPDHHHHPPPQQHTLDGLVIIYESYQQQQRPYHHPIWIRRHAEDVVEILVHPPLFSSPPTTPLWTKHNTRTSSHRQQPSSALSAYLWPALCHVEDEEVLWISMCVGGNNNNIIFIQQEGRWAEFVCRGKERGSSGICENSSQCERWAGPCRPVVVSPRLWTKQ